MNSSETPPSASDSSSSTNKEVQNWKEAWNFSPGPRTRKEFQWLALKGICMGSADIIPGVSGGTIAFITGIYTQWLAAIASINLIFFKKLLSFELRGALAEVHVRFLLPLLLGIGVAIVSTARLMHYLITEHGVLTWSLFFGLILASIFVVGKEIDQWNGSAILFIGLGALAAFLIVGLIPVSTPESWWFIILSGIIAICAMVLPGLSGSFILLILGKYEFVTGAVKNPFNLENILIILLFASGCAIGIMGFSRILKYLLARYHSATMAILTGVMIGAMRKVWPWKEVLESKVVRGKIHVLQEQNIFPPQLDAQVIFAFFLMLIGIVFVLSLEKFSRSSRVS
ncbi:MAG: DUF368 domain-containing protein [SAR324 cluster bacterium]|nr:DUF368 domain-containing protein [SAR324 cluster bacterium]